jgi:hypothetical protein
MNIHLPTAAETRFLKTTLDDITRVDAVIRNDSRSVNAVGQALVGIISCREAELTLLDQLQIDFRQSIKSISPEISCKYITMNHFLKSFGTVPSWITPEIQQQWGERTVMSFFIPRHLLESALIFNDDYLMMKEFTENIGPLLGFPGALYDERKEGVYFRFFPNPILMGAAEWIGGKGAVGREVSAEETSPTVMFELRSRNMRPFRLSTYRYSIHDLEEVHPFLGALHDLFHIIYLSVINAGTRGAIWLFGDAIADVTKGLYPPESLQELFVDGPDLTRGRSPRAIVTSAVREVARDYVQALRRVEVQQGFVRLLKKSLERRLKNHPERENMMAAFQEQLEVPFILAAPGAPGHISRPT